MLLLLKLISFSLSLILEHSYNCVFFFLDELVIIQDSLELYAYLLIYLIKEVGMFYAYSLIILELLIISLFYEGYLNHSC